MSITDNIFAKILTEIKKGHPLRTILVPDDMPDQVTLQKELRDNPDMQSKYKAAKRFQRKCANADPEFREKCMGRRRQHNQERANAKTKHQSP